MKYFQPLKTEWKLFASVTVVAVIIAVGGILLLQAGLGSSSPTPAPVAQTSPSAPSPKPQAEVLDTSNWQTYRNEEYGVQFQYPATYSVVPSIDDRPCFLVVRPESSCVVAFTIIADNSEYAPRGSFYLVRGVNSVNIPGQVQNIVFDEQMNVWLLKSYTGDDLLQTWSYTSSGDEIIKTSNGGSGGDSAYYIVPNYEKDVVAIFQVPRSRRLWCESMEQGAEREACESFYQSAIDQYGGEEDAAQTWLPKGYFDTIYKDAERILSTFRFITPSEDNSSQHSREFMKPAGEYVIEGCSEVERRVAAKKPTHTIVDTGFSRDVFTLLFAKGSGIRLREGELVSINEFNIDNVKNILSQFQVSRIERLISSSEEKVEADRIRIEQKSCREQADFNLYYRVWLEPGQETEKLINSLNALEIVEIAYPGTPITPPPPPGG